MLPSPVSRRRFLTVASAAALAGATRSLAAPAPKAPAPAPVPFPPRKGGIPIGLELYSVRGELTKNLPATLQGVAAAGYEVVEFYSPYVGWTFPYAKDVKGLMDDLGLRCLSTHNPATALQPANIGKTIELNQILGARHIVVASPPAGTKGLEGWKQACALFTEASTRLQPHGLRAGYHNHATEWKPLDGGPRIMDVIAANTPAEFVLQLDVGTCVEAGADPVAWIKAHPGRIRNIHLKDWAPGTKAEEKAFRVLFGEGVSPWKEICAAAESVGGVEVYLLEQEGSRFPEMETARRSLELWRKFRQKA